MIKIDNIETFGWEAAIRGMRNPLNSWDKSDSDYCINYGTIDCSKCPYFVNNMCSLEENEQYINYIVGPNDLELMKKLTKSGTDHSKFMRMIHVQMDITAPLYWWLEFDTYKVGTVANSCSKMHKIHDKEFVLDDFSCEHLQGDSFGLLYNIIDELNKNRKEFNETKDKKYWWQIIQLLPESYNQKRTVDLNYGVIHNMYFARHNHKLDEWREFCDTMSNELPYFAEIIGVENEDE